MGTRFIQVSVVYFAIGVLLGFYMSVASNYDLTGVHVHINLLGWASFALSGIIYQLYPRAGTHRLATYHFWTANIGLPLMMGGLTVLLLAGISKAILFISIGATIVVVSVLLFMINILMHTRK